jgi:hypothetical protein
MEIKAERRPYVISSSQRRLSTCKGYILPTTLTSKHTRIGHAQKSRDTVRNDKGLVLKLFSVNALPAGPVAHCERKFNDG